MIFFQLKMMRKGIKPPIWRRAYVPSNITFTQMALVLEEILEIQKSDWFEFEFYTKKDRLIEWHEEDENVCDFYYSYLSAPDTYVNDWLMNEKWFTFRIRGGNSQMPEYRIEVEKILDDIRYKEGGEEIHFTYPLILKEISVRDDPYWTHGIKHNDRLKNMYFLKEQKAEYGNLSEVIAQIEEKRGLGYCKNPVNRHIHTKKSANAVLEEAAELMSETLYAKSVNQVQGKMSKSETTSLAVKKPQNVTMEGWLKSFTKEDLTAAANEINYRIAASRKDQMVHELARVLLEPQMMREQLLLAQEEELDALEAAMNRERFQVTEQEWNLLENIFDLNYLAAYVDDTVVVPEEVKAIYEIIKKNGYRQYHRKTQWLMLCLKLFEAIHVVAPTKILYQMYKQNKEVIVTYPDFVTLLDMLPDRLNPCERIDDKIVAKAALENKIYTKIEEQQREIGYYIPTMKEIMDYGEEDYPFHERAYSDLRDFWNHDMKLDEKQSGYLCEEAFRTFSMGGKLSDYMDVISPKGIDFISDKILDKFASIMMNVNNNTRMYVLKGHTPNEMSQDSIATKISAIKYSDGNAHKSQPSIKKVYPNDPCPCGSGKKFKKCCGKNKSGEIN